MRSDGNWKNLGGLDYYVRTARVMETGVHTKLKSAYWTRVWIGLDNRASELGHKTISLNRNGNIV